MWNLSELLAGMPTINLTDIAKLRLDAISFFLVGLLLVAWGVQVLWNLLSRDIPKMPKIRYSTSLAGTVLWGLLFMLVLTMISGAKELMTPGAWKKSGLTYTLASASPPNLTDTQTVSVKISLLEQRHARMELLRTMLWAYAAAHEGRFPDSIETSGIAKSLWEQPGTIPATYGYVSGLTVEDIATTLVFEYGVYEDQTQLILYTDGEIAMEDRGAAGMDLALVGLDCCIGRADVHCRDLHCWRDSSVGVARCE